MERPYASVWTWGSDFPPTTGRRAALAALAEGGLAAVAVEPLAARLGATKGSFYWHFAGRDALVAATLERWERTDTEDVITAIEAEPDLVARLRLLLTHALDGGARVELALQPTATHPLVAPVLARVTRRRLDYLTDVFTGLGFDRRHGPRAQRARLHRLPGPRPAHRHPGRRADRSPALRRVGGRRTDRGAVNGRYFTR